MPDMEAPAFAESELYDQVISYLRSPRGLPALKTNNVEAIVNDNIKPDLEHQFFIELLLDPHARS